MAPDKLSPGDSRVEHHTAQINGKTYHYLLGKPTGPPVGTILLVHGFPDLALGWRYQVPPLLSQGLRVIVPDMLGYGQTDAPESLSEYSHKSISADMAALAAHVVPGEQIILGGHDWGGFLVWRIYLWHPELIRGVFSVCTPYGPPRPQWIPDETFTQLLPNFKYQLQFAGPEVEAKITGKDKLRQFLNGMYGGKSPDGQVIFSTDVGVLFDQVDKIGPSPLLSAEEVDYYVEEYARHGLRGPLNWYRTRRINFEEELALVEAGRAKIEVPSMIITATHDAALPPAMAADMDQYFDSLTKRQVKAGHWALWQAAEETNGNIKEFLTGLLKTEGTLKAQI